MTKLINVLLVIIIILLVSMLGYRILSQPEITKIPAVTTIEKPSAASTSLDKPSVPTDEELTKKIELVINSYLMENPEIIIKSIEGLQKRKMQEIEGKVQNYITDKKYDIENINNAPYAGNVKGDITIVSFYDYNCNYCKKGNEALDQLLEHDKNIKVVYRPFPILGEPSIYATKLALAVYKVVPDKFQIIHEGLMKLKPLNKDSVERLINDQKLDVTRIEGDMNKPEVKDLINKNLEFAQNLHIQGAPAYLINDKLVPGLLSFEELQKIISEIRSRSETEATKPS